MLLSCVVFIQIPIDSEDQVTIRKYIHETTQTEHLAVQSFKIAFLSNNVKTYISIIRIIVHLMAERSNQTPSCSLGEAISHAINAPRLMY